MDEKLASTLFPNEYSSYNAKANERLKITIMNLCFICTKDPIIKTVIIIDKLNHVMCEECDKRYATSPSYSSNQKIECVFCNQTHIINLSKKLKQNATQKKKKICCLCI